MSDQILSQEEIDALLTAMDRGEDNIKIKDRLKHRVLPCSIITKNEMFQDQVIVLKAVSDKFILLLNTSLSITFQRPITAKFISTETVKYSEYIDSFHRLTSFTLFSMDPLNGQAMLVIEPKLVNSLVDFMFGGDGKPIQRLCEFTPIEMRLIRKFSVEVLRAFSQAWQIVCPIKIEVKKEKIKPQFVKLASQEESIVTIAVAVKGGKFSGEINLCLPFHMLEPLRGRLLSWCLPCNDKEHVWNDKLIDLLDDMPITLIAELGLTSKTVKDVLNLQVNDFFQLNSGPEDLITVKAGKISKFLGFPGVIKGNRAVEITELIQKKGV